MFVYGSNDMYSPVPKNPARYLWRTSRKPITRRVRSPTCRTEELGAAMTAAGWLDLNNHVGSLKVGELEVEFGGINDSHIGKDRYDRIAGPVSPEAAEHRRACTPRNPATSTASPPTATSCCWPGHTHGGQLCVPFYGALVTNCGIDTRPGEGPAPHTAARLAPRVRRPGHLTVRAGPVLLPTGGLAADVWCRRSAILVRGQGRMSARVVPAQALYGDLLPPGCSAAW